MMVIMISAKQGGGKTSLAEKLCEGFPKCGRTRFAKPLYEMHDAVLNILNRYTDGSRTLDKTLLQLIGTDWGRKTVSENIWVDCFKKEISRMSAARLNFAVVDDLRFKNEFEAVPAIKIRLECDKNIRRERCSQWRENDSHQSETDLDDWIDKFDLVIDTGKNSQQETFNIVKGFIDEKILRGLGARP